MAGTTLPSYADIIQDISERNPDNLLIWINPVDGRYGTVTRPSDRDGNILIEADHGEMTSPLAEALGPRPPPIYRFYNNYDDYIEHEPAMFTTSTRQVFVDMGGGAAVEYLVHGFINNESSADLPLQLFQMSNNINRGVVEMIMANIAPRKVVFTGGANLTERDIDFLERVSRGTQRRILLISEDDLDDNQEHQMQRIRAFMYEIYKMHPDLEIEFETAGYGKFASDTIFRSNPLSELFVYVAQRARNIAILDYHDAVRKTSTGPPFKRPRNGAVAAVLGVVDDRGESIFSRDDRGRYREAISYFDKLFERGIVPTALPHGEGVQQHYFVLLKAIAQWRDEIEARRLTEEARQLRNSRTPLW